MSPATQRRNPLIRSWLATRLLFFGIEYERKGPALKFLMLSLDNTLGAGRVAHISINRSTRACAEQIVVFAIGARQENAAKCPNQCALETPRSRQSPSRRRRPAG